MTAGIKRVHYPGGRCDISIIVLEESGSDHGVEVPDSGGTGFVTALIGCWWGRINTDSLENKERLTRSAVSLALTRRLITLVKCRVERKGIVGNRCARCNRETMSIGWHAEKDLRV